jgi:multiple sugar transport system substrate-binding protein
MTGDATPSPNGARDGDAEPEPRRPDRVWWARAGRAARATAVRARDSLVNNWFVLLTFAVGVLVGVLLSTVAANGWPLVGGGDDDIGGDTLTVLSGQDDSPNQQHRRLIETWNRLHPEMKAQIVELSADASNAQSTMQTRAETSAHDVDVYNLDVTAIAEFAEKDWIVPLKDVDTTGFLEKPLDACRYRGDLWALPFNTDAGLLYYRPDQLVAHGIDAERAELGSRPPQEWSTLSKIIDAAFDEPRAAGDPLEAGYTGQFADYEGLTVNVMEAIWAEGGEVVDADGEVRLDSEEANRALRALRTALRSPDVALPGTRTFKETESTTAFRDGKVLFMRNWPLAYRQLTAPASETAPTAGAARRPAVTDVEVTRLPGPSALGGQNLAVASESPHQEQAKELVEFLTSEGSQQILFQDGGFAATRQRIYEDPFIRLNYGYATTLLEAVKDAKLRPVTPYYDTFSREFRRIVTDVFTTGRDVSDNDVRRLQDALEGKLES